MAKAGPVSPQQDALIEQAAFALSPAQRELLRQRVLEELETLPEIGDGAISARWPWTSARPLHRPRRLPSDRESRSDGPASMLGGSPAASRNGSRWRSAISNLAASTSYVPRIKGDEPGPQRACQPAGRPLFPCYVFIQARRAWSSSSAPSASAKSSMTGDRPATINDAVVTDSGAPKRSMVWCSCLPGPNSNPATACAFLTYCCVTRSASSPTRRRERIVVLLQLLGTEHSIALPRGAVMRMPSGQPERPRVGCAREQPNAQRQQRQRPRRDAHPQRRNASPRPSIEELLKRSGRRVTASID